MASPGEIDQLFWSLGANTAPLVAGVGRAKQSIASLAKNVLSLRGGLIAIGTIGALAFLKATSAAAKLDKPLREVSTLIPQTVEDMGELRKEIIALSTRVPQPPEQLTKGLYQVISAGVTDTAEAMDVLEIAATAATAGLATSQDAVLAITTVLNAFQLESSEAARISDIFFKTIAQGVITFPEIASSIGDMATTAAQAGVSVEEMTAALAAMTKAGINASEATTSLNRLFLAIVDGDLGSEFDLSAVAADGFAGTMNKLEEATRGDVEALKAVVTDIRSFRAAAVIAGNQNAEFNRILGETSDATGATRIAFDKMNASLQAQSELLKNRVNAFFLEFGKVTLPIVILAVKTLNRVLGATEFDAPAAGAEALAMQVEAASDRVNELRGNIVRLEVRTSAQVVAGLGLEPGDIDNLREAREELERMIQVRARFLEEQTRRRVAAPSIVAGDGIAEISDEIQALRDQLATQLQDELVAITASAVDDMELEFERLQETIIKAFGKIPDEWKVVLDEMRDEIEDTLTGEVAAAVAKLREDLGDLRRGFGRVSNPVGDLDTDIEALTNNIFLLTRAFAELGQGFGLFGRDVASAVNSIATIGEGIKGVFAASASGASVLGPIGAIAGGLAGLGGLIFGGESERVRVLKANNEALERLTNTMEASLIKGGVSGSLVSAGISAIGGATRFPDIPFGTAQPRRRAAFEAEVEAALLAAGFTMDQLTDLAEQWNITLDGSLSSWNQFQEALQEVQAAELFEGFAGGMRRMRIEWELTDTIDPAKKLADANKEWEKLTGIAAPKNADDILAFWEKIKSGDLSFLGDLSANDAIAFLQLFEGLFDEIDPIGKTTSFAVSRSITEVTGNRIAGILTTDVFWNQQTALNTAGILDALGGTQGGLIPPTSMGGGIGDVTINITGSTNPVATADAVADAFIDMVDRGLGERGRDTRRSRGDTLPTAV